MLNIYKKNLIDYNLKSLDLKFSKNFRSILILGILIFALVIVLGYCILCIVLTYSISCCSESEIRTIIEYCGDYEMQSKLILQIYISLFLVFLISIIIFLNRKKLFRH